MGTSIAGLTYALTQSPWCSWLSRQPNMLKVSSSNLDGDIFFAFLDPKQPPYCHTTPSIPPPIRRDKNGQNPTKWSFNREIQDPYLVPNTRSRARSRMAALFHGLVFAVTTTPQAPASTLMVAESDATCPNGRFYAHRQELTEAEMELERDLISLCDLASFHCSRHFVERMMNHPCRTLELNAQTKAVAVVHPLTRFFQTPGQFSLLALAAVRHFNYSMTILSRLPSEVREHPTLYLFSGGEAFNTGDYDHKIDYPLHATVFIIEPLWAQRHSEAIGHFDHSYHSCFLYRPSHRYASVPFWQGRVLDTVNSATALAADVARTDESRAHRVFHYAALHGQTIELRRRLYDLCDGEAGWYCPRETSLPEPGHQSGNLPLTTEGYVRAFGQTTFALVPTGDSPGRSALWDCLRRGCVPVVFSSCPRTHVLESHNGWLPADDEPVFGARRWAVLLNQTAVMTSDTYLRVALAAISDEKIAAMRAEMRPFLRRISYSATGADDDALAHTINHMLQGRKGSPEEGPALPTGFETVCEQCIHPPTEPDLRVSNIEAEA